MAFGGKNILTTDADTDLSVNLRLTDGTDIQAEVVPAAQVVTEFGASLVFRPGGVAGNGVFTTWATLAAAVAVLDPATAKTVSIDDSIAAAHAIVGVWPGFENTTFESGGPDATSGANATLIFDQGAQLSGVEHLYFHALNLTFNSTLPVVVGPTTANLFVELILSNTSNGAGGVGLAQIGAGLAVRSTHRLSVVGGQLYTGSATSTYSVVLLDGSSVVANAVNGTAGGTVVLTVDGASQAGVAAQTPAAVVSVLDPQPTFVFRPGATGVLDANVFTTWAALYAAASLTTGNVSVLIDDTLGAAHVTAGTFAVDHWVFYGQASATQAASTLIFDDGAHFTFSMITLDGIVFEENGSTSCLATTPVFTTILMRGNGCQLKSNLGKATWAHGSVDFFLNIFLLGAGCQLGDGTHNVVDAGNAVDIAITLVGSSTLQAHALGGAGAIANVTTSSDATVSATQDIGTTNITFASKASQTSFAAATAGNWNPNPTLVKTALDQLAAPNSTPLAAGNSGTGTATVTAGATAGITKAKNGQMKVRASCAFVTSGATTVTAQLVRDAATNIGTPKALVFAGAAACDMGIDFVDTAPDAASHTYKCTFTASGGATLSVSANSAQIQVVEDS